MILRDNFGLIIVQKFLSVAVEFWDELSSTYITVPLQVHVIESKASLVVTDSTVLANKAGKWSAQDTFIPLSTSDGGNTVAPSGQTIFAEGAVYSTPDFGKVPVAPTKPTLTLVDEPKKPDAIKASYHLYDMPRRETTSVAYHKYLIAIDQTPKPSITNNTTNNYSYTTNNYTTNNITNNYNQPTVQAQREVGTQPEKPALPETGKKIVDDHGVETISLAVIGASLACALGKPKKLPN